MAIAAYDDIDRYKSYHLRNKRPQDRARSDVVKRAAYFTKWIVKLRPIMTVRSEKLKISEDVSPLVNESIAIGYAITLIKAECGKYFRLTDKAYFELQYDLHFRPMGEDALVAAYQIIVDLVKAGTDNAIVVFNSNPSD